ncbi:hypothetical protein [Nocardioides sp. T2.26MG-1]|uniref:hypothetical protein n=1 Tax=Nocardioides sp. T2.26MG-1 TaxID=3041166 RepID=UPI00247775B6|nr:hypothetical protein [Nocardioides sp. T2.26MG-1]CAI9404998.1 hypothetical protein HIDPHFAB_04293 [Nocardioides sp. T2.26MG-1]
MRVTSIPGPRRPSTAVEPLTASVPRERREPGHSRREPIDVHVPAPIRPSGAVSAVAEAYGQYGERRAVDLYL